jgi:hypothetical protein
VIYTIRRYGRSFVTLSAFALVALLPAAAEADVILSGNLSGATGGTEAASGDTWLTAGFGTDASTYKLTAVTLLLSNPTTGKAELDIYDDGGLQPGSLVGTLDSPSSYSSGLTATTFTTSGINLSANSNYWVVLKATSGEFDWAWTTDNTGTGAGFQGTWGNSSDAGSTWFTYGIYPTQMSVSVAPTAVPEPGSLALCGAGAVVLLLQHRYRRWSAGGHPAARPSLLPKR